MTQNETFFYRNAGYSVANGETKRQGRVHCAKAMARAEEYAQEHGWRFVWEDDPDGCIGCDCGADECDCASGNPHETLMCAVYGEDSRYPLASCGGICGATREYGRVMEAELALEAMANKKNIVQR